MRHVLFFVLLAACGGDPETTTPAGDAPAEAASSVPAKAARAAEIAVAIRESPERAEAILQEHGTTRADFEALLYEIAADPALSRGYAAAME